MRITFIVRTALSALLLALPALGAAQSTIRTAARPALRSVARPDSLSPEQRQLLVRHCPAGAPKLDRVWAHVPTRLVIRRGYALQHSSVDRIPLWVCEGLTPEQLAGTVDRADAFAPDPALPAGVRAELADYKGTGFDRGHMAPAADQSVDPELKAETFFLSNMAPQAPRLNQQIWRVLEDTVRQWLQRRGGGFVITGGLFHDPAEDDPKTADGVVVYQTIGENAVAVPTHFYKIVAAPRAGGGFEVIAFVMENRDHPRPFRFSDHVRPVDWIEKQTGIDFFPDLPSRDQAKLESASPPMWQ